MKELKSFKCKYCDRNFSTPQARGYHERRCNSNPNRIHEKFRRVNYPTSVCPICGKTFVNCNFGRHLAAHETENNDTGWHLSHDGLCCEFCGKEFSSRNALAQHEIRCPSNENRIPTSLNGVRAMSSNPWNKGLTKETDERIKRNAESVKRTFNKMVEDGWVPECAKYWEDPEHRKEQSERKKQLYAEHPEKHPNRKLSGNRSQMSYPECVAFDWLTNNSINFQHQYRILSFNDEYRYVDFYLPELNIFIEIDGEYWHKDCKEEDDKKDVFALQKYGIKTFRIHPKENIQEQLSKIIFDKQ